MAENLVKPWYPKRNLKAYSYVDKLQEENMELYSEVKNLLGEAKHTTDKARAPSLKRLESLWKEEREKEIALIRFLMQDDPDFNLPQQVGDYIRIINHLFSLDAVFERNISRIQAITKGSKEGKIDVSSFFNTYLEGTLRDYLKIWLESGKPTINIKDLKEVFYQAMLKMFSATDNGEQAYLALASSLEQLSIEERDELLEDIFYLYFGKSLSSIVEDFRNMGDIDFNPSAVYVTKGKGFQGNVLETVELLTLQEVEKALSAKGIKATAKGTGKSGVKADNVLTIGFQLTKQQQELFDGIGKTNSSVRVQNIERMQALHDSIKRSKQSGYIVEISDKNYTLTSNDFASQKGFTAQRGVKLSNLKETLKNIKFQQGKVEDIIFVLANSGSGMINKKETEEIRNHLATLIAYFLFDDIDIKNFIPTQPAAIHLLNLNGVQIPLSVFLEAACEAFAASVEQADGFVHVSFSESQEAKDYNKDNILTKKDWLSFRADRMKNTSINFHFFGNFVNFISEKII